MHVITKSCILLLWMHTLTFVKSQGNPADCTLQDFKNGPLYDPNFDITPLEARYPGGRQVRVGCNVGYTGFFKLLCVEGKWQSRGSKCQLISCGHPGDAQFADFHLARGEDFVFGSQVDYTCHKGFQMVSRINFRRCMSEGWDGVVPVCEAQQCPSIHVPSNVKVTGDTEEATYGNVVRFSCKSGNQILKGPREVFCNEDGEWSEPVDSISCKALNCRKPVIANGVVEGNIDEYDENGVLHYWCVRGHKQIQGLDSRCMNSGGRAEWIPTPACEAIKCELSLPALRGTTYEPAYKNRFSPGEKVRVTCGNTYWILDSQTLSAETTCKEDGEWTIRPVCQEVTCSPPRDRYFSYWEYRFGEQKRLGDTVRYRCNPDYRSTDGATQATCTRDGWQPNPLCREVKCAKRIYNNADIISKIQSEYRQNDRVTYRCKGVNEKRFTLTCGENDWIGDNLCTGCQIENSKHRFHVWPPGNKLYYTCEDGYKPLTKGWWAEATCDDGVWSGLEDCIEECGDPPVIPNGEGTLQSFGDQPPNSTFITCNKGYTAVIEDLTCHEGRWNLTGLSLNAICRPNPVTCSPPLKVENAVVKTPFQKEYPSDSKVTYQCRDKYTVEGEATITCTAGVWEELNIKCILHCEQLKDQWQTMIFTADKAIYKNEETIEYECKTKAGSYGIATCQEGKWNKTIECEDKCTVPEIPAGVRITTDSPGSQLMKGHNLTFTCEDSSHIIKGNAKVECLANGEWSNPFPTCEEKCTVPEIPAGVRITTDSPGSQLMRGQNLTFTCEDSSHIIKGNAKVECLANGEWSNPFPTCEAARGCGSPPSLSNGKTRGRKKTPYSHDDKVEYVCDRDYSMEGGPFKTCIDGEWTGELRCRPAQGCGRPPLLPDGDTKTTIKYQYNHNEKVEYVCQNYYIMEGGPFKTCISGEWTGNIKCLQACTVDSEEMQRHNIRFKYSRDDKLYSTHNDIIEFVCTRGRPVDSLGMRQRCNLGVIELPTCA